MQSTVVGGILPAVFVGLALTFLKLAGNNGIGAGTGIFITGIGVMIAGGIANLLGLSGFGSSKAVFLSLLMGIFWGTGTVIRY